ncbi:MAG: conjugal transfer protein TraK [Plesiomonas sp.]
MRHYLCMPLSLLILCPSWVHADTAEEVPVVPVSVMKQDESKSLPSSGRGGGRDAIGQINNGAVLTMIPGVNQIIPIAIGHPNRIVTPFASPEVVSTSLTGATTDGQCGEVCIKENVIYVATDKVYPVTMFITERGSEAQALSITMVPRRIPPREVFLKLNASQVQTVGGNAKARSWETSQPYVDTVRTIFRNIALGEVPQGYTMTSIPADVARPHCVQGGLRIEFAHGQYVVGHHLSVFIGVATNTANQAIEFKEAMCGSWEVAAVTSWPLKVLEPGQKTEVYVAMKQRSDQGRGIKRPSLLGGAQ